VGRNGGYIKSESHRLPYNDIAFGNATEVCMLRLPLVGVEFGGLISHDNKFVRSFTEFDAIRRAGGDRAVT
jgi:hypothetical protein